MDVIKSSNKITLHQILTHLVLPIGQSLRLRSFDHRKTWICLSKPQKVIVPKNPFSEAQNLKKNHRKFAQPGQILGFPGLRTPKRWKINSEESPGIVRPNMKVNFLVNFKSRHSIAKMITKLNLFFQALKTFLFYQGSARFSVVV